MFDLIREALPVTLTVFIGGAVIGWVVGELLGRIGTWSRRPFSGAGYRRTGVLSATIFPPFLVFVLVRWLRDPLLDAREAMGLPSDSLELWRDAVTGEPGALTPGDVRWLVALGLCAALVVALAVRAYGRRSQLPLVEGLAIPAALVGVGVGIWLADLGPHAARPALPGRHHGDHRPRDAGARAGRRRAPLVRPGDAGHARRHGGRAVARTTC